MQQEFKVGPILKGLWRFKWIVAMLIVVAGGISWRFTSTQAVVYEATATVIVENAAVGKSPALPAGLEAALGFNYMPDIRSQIEVMKSRSVLERAITTLEPEKASDPQYLQLEVQRLSRSLTIKQVTGTNLVNLNVVSTDPWKSQRQANAVAGAYVFETGRAKLTAIETALENTTQRLKQLSAGKLDLSISPSLTATTTQINASRTALKTASEHLRKAAAMAAQSPGPVDTAKDPGTTTTPVHLSAVIGRLTAATAQAKEITGLTQHLEWQRSVEDFEQHSNNIATLETEARALATKLSAIIATIEPMRRSEIDPLVHGELLVVEEQLRVAAANEQAVLQQVLALYSIKEQLRVATTSAGAIMDQLAALYGVSDQLRAAAITATSIPVQAVAAQREAEAGLARRIVQHTRSTVNSMDLALAQLKTIKPRAAAAEVKTVEFQKLSQTARQKLTDSAVATTLALDWLAQQLAPPASGNAVLMTNAEVAAIGIRAQTAAATLAFLVGELESIQPNEQFPEDYAELLSARESVRVANEAVRGLPEAIGNLARGAGDGLTYTALDSLRQQLQLSLLTVGSGGAKVMDSAMVSTPATTQFSRLRNVIIAVIAALLLAILGVMAVLATDRKVHDASQVTSLIGLPTLAIIPKIADMRDSHSLSLFNGSPLHYLEAFRMLRTNLNLDSRQGWVLLVSSPDYAEGKTTIAANLARAVALQGRKVLLIDGNLRKPNVAAAFSLGQADGLSSFLAGHHELQDIVSHSDGVDILAWAGAPDRAAEELSSPMMKRLLERAKQLYDVVIVDSARITGYADTRILAKAVDEVVLVLQANASTLDLAKESKEYLEDIGVHLSGIVLNKVECNGSKSRKRFSFRKEAPVRG